MVDALGYQAKFAVVAPSTNTIVQPEFDRMAPHWTCHAKVPVSQLMLGNPSLESQGAFAAKG
jgi:maleate isomerase